MATQRNARRSGSGRQVQRGRRTLGAIALAITSVVALVVPSTTAGAARPASTASARADAAWILAAQLPSGALATYRDRTFIDPYLANLSSIGLSRAYAVTRDPGTIAAVWRWLGWYSGHMDTLGVVHNYRVVNGAEIDTGAVDSTDGSSGTFLMAVYEAWRVTGNRTALQTLVPAVRSAVGAIEAVQDSDGMTWATPTFHVKYLMNEAEVVGGLRAAAELARVVGDAALVQRAANDGAAVLAGVATLWNPATGSYDWALHENGARTSTDWRQLYPDAMQQVWAVTFGLADPARASALMTKFVQMHPSWARPTATDLVEGSARVVGYWPVVGWGLLRVNQRGPATAGAASIRAAADAAARAWPWSVAEAGELIVLDSGTLPAVLTLRNR